jgi:predicted membrane-bound spermidine synthase
MVSDLRIALWVGFAVLGLTEALALTGITQSPHSRLLGIYASPHAVFVLGEFATVFCILYLCSRPRGREIVIAGVGGVLLTGLYLGLRPHEAARAVSDWLYLFIGAFGLTAVFALIARVRGAPSQRLLALTLVAAFALVLVYDTFVVSLLGFTAALHPRTYDAIAFNLDSTLGFSPVILISLVVNAWPPLLAVATAVYDYLPYAFAVVYGLQLARPERAPVSLLLAYTVSGAIAIFLYHACPIAGPRYAFGDYFYAWGPAAPANDLLAVPPAPRNGMPSMHFGWALLMWMHASFLGAGVRALFAVLAGLMFLATLGLGQHYLVDLAAAPPAIVALQALCATGLGWANRERLRALATGGMLTLAWILAVRYGIALFDAVPGLTWAALAATVAASVRVYVPLARALRGASPAVLREARVAGVPGGTRREAAYAGAMFVVSGFAALLYQVLFSKSLALTFGSTSTATYTVLAVYMGGMALGAWLGGRLAQGRSDALKLYAWCELGIGAYCVATPLIFKSIQALYVALASGVEPDAGMLTVLRALLGASALLVPTVLMGATLPVLARFFELRSATLGASVALLYGANTVGAALGALLAGYWILPELGVWRSTLTAAALNLGVAWLALRLARRPLPEGQPMAPPAAVPGAAEAEARRLGQVALVVLAVGGVVTLALEVNYIHLLAVVAGNSVYAFSLMLFAFLLGLGAGAELARRLLSLRISFPLALAWLEFALAAVILGGVFLWDGLPAYFASFDQYPLAREFAAREVVRGAVCWVAMFPPAVLIGALYPLAMECVGRAAPDAPIAALGRAAGLNTAGNIVGVLAAGFWLLPAIGVLRSIQLLAGICLILGLATIAWTALKRRPLTWVPAAAVVLLLIAQPRSFDYTALASGANIYFMRQDYGRAIDAVESADGGLTTVARGDPVVEGSRAQLTLLTNGKFQGSNGGEVPAQVGFGLSPLLHTPARGSALVIGYGTGMSARVIADAGFRELDIVELSVDIVRLANRHFADINTRVSERRGVRTYITDGRNFLMLQPRSYDVVSMEITSIWFAGAAALYNREFYRLVKRRLAPHGVLQQWLQLHHVETTDILHVLSSVRAEFEYVWLYFIGTQGIIIATNSPDAGPSVQNAALIDATPALKELLASTGGSARDLLKTRLLDPAATDLFLSSFGMPAPFWVSTDDNLKLEYSTPKGNALDGAASIARNIELLLNFAAAPRGARQ